MEFIQQYIFVAANKTTETALQLQLPLPFTLQSPPRKEGLPALKKTDVKGERGQFATGQGRNDFQDNVCKYNCLQRMQVEQRGCSPTLRWLCRRPQESCSEPAGKWAEAEAQQGQEHLESTSTKTRLE